MIVLRCVCTGILLTSCSSDAPNNAIPLPNPIVWLNNPNNIQHVNFSKQVVLLYFLTNDCDGCRQLLTTLSKVKNNHEKQINIVGIFTPNPNYQFNSSEARTYVESLKITYPVVYDVNSILFNGYRLNGWPTLILINKKNEIKKKIYGIQSAEYLSQIIQEVIKEK